MKPCYDCAKPATQHEFGRDWCNSCLAAIDKLLAPSPQDTTEADKITALRRKRFRVPHEL